MHNLRLGYFCAEKNTSACYKFTVTGKNVKKGQMTVGVILLFTPEELCGALCSH